ncbi:MFS transporter [Microbacterium sp. NPDC089189]|uniref:MFS transporter n=1 Tax=Microbacterium sp. NPDC089189 TaxID=3154972 RepID=UPI0034262AFF
MTAVGRSRGAAALAVLGIVLFAFSLRTAVASLSPVIDQIGRDFPLSPSLVGLIGTAPPVCYAVFGIVTPALEARVGLRRLVPAAIAVAALGLFGRALAGDALMLLLATVLVFAAVGVGNVLLPPLVKRYFPDRIGLMTTVFTTTMALATFVPPLIAVPVAEATDWRVSLGIWAVFGVLAVVPWLVLGRGGDVRAEDPARTSGRVLRRMWGLPMTWALICGFAVTSGTAYTAFAWLPLILVDTAGVTGAQAGALLSLFAVMGLPCSLAVPLVITRFRRGVPVLFAVAVMGGLGGSMGLLFLPGTATWLWVALLGVCPLLFPVVLVLLSLRTRTHDAAVALSGVVQSVGYAIAALFPFAVGIIHTVTGGWTVPIALLAGLALVAIPAGIVASRRRTVEEEWERRHGTW